MPSVRNSAGLLLTMMSFAIGCRAPVLLSCVEDCAQGGDGGAPMEPSLPTGSDAGETNAAPEASGAGAPSGGGAANADQAGGVGAEEPTTSCRSDAACQDGSYCNGPERCEAGSCVGGTGVECVQGTACEERSNAAGCFLPRTRLLLWTGDDFHEGRHDVAAVPLESRGEAPPVDLSLGATDDKFQYAWDMRWSPDGRRLVFFSMEADFVLDRFVSRFYWLDVDAPLSAQPQRLPNIPVSDLDYSVTDWSVDGSLVVIGHPASADEPGESHFVVRFDETGAESVSLPSPAPITLCADDTTIAYAIDGTLRLRSLWQPERQERAIEASLRGRSPDGKWLLISDADGAALLPCALDGEPERLGGPAAVSSGWSSDSRFLVYADRDAENGEEPAGTSIYAFRVEHAERHASLFEGVAADSRVSFEPHGSRFVYAELTTKDEVVWHARDLVAGSDVVLPIANDVGEPGLGQYVGSIRWLGDTGRITDHRSTMAVSEPLAQRDLLGGEEFSEDGKHAIWLESEGEGTQLYAQELSSPSVSPLPLFAQPLSGEVWLPYGKDARLVLRLIEDPEPHMDLYIIPDDYGSEPMKVNNGTSLDDIYLAIQPLR